MLRSVLPALIALTVFAGSPAHAWDPAKAGRYGRVDADSLDVGGPITLRGTLKTPDGAVVGGVNGGVFTSSPPALSVQSTGQTPAPILDLRSGTRPTNGLWSRGDGTLIDFCSQTGCLQDYPGLLAQTFLQATTRVDNAQEMAFHTNLHSVTGYSPYWKPSTSYTNVTPSLPGQVSLVLVGGGFAGNLYKNVGGPCTSASSGPGPQGTNPNVDIIDGTCRWRWYADGLNAGKSNLSVSTVADPGAGQTWGLVTAFNASGGLGDIGMYPHEFDCNNYNKESNISSGFFMNCFYMGGGGGGTFPMFSAFYFDNANRSISGSAGYNYGLWFSGNDTDTGTLVKEATIADLSRSKYTLQAWQGRPKLAFLKDDSASLKVLEVTGNHQYGLDLANANYSSGVALTVPTSSFITFKTGLGAALGYNGTALQYGPTSGSPVFSIDDNGGVSTSGGVLTPALTTQSIRETQPLTVPSASSPCAIGQHAWDANYEYRCVATNTWKRASLSSW